MSPLASSITSLSCAISLAGCGSTATRDVSAAILEASGVVVIVDSRTTTPNQMKESDRRVAPGFILKTGTDGRLALALLPGALIQLEPNSQLLIEQITIGKNGFASEEAMRRSIRLHLLEGVLHAAVQWESEPAGWILKTPHGRLLNGMSGFCRVEVGGAKTRVIAARGGFTFVPNDGTAAIHLGSGFTQEWPVPLFAPFPAELDQGTLSQVQAAHNMERKLLALQRRLWSTPYPWRQVMIPSTLAPPGNQLAL